MPVSLEQSSNLMKKVSANLAKVIYGKKDKLDLVVLALAAGGHVLIDDIPGVGKTTLARALAKSVKGKFARIQFTPDLLPTDITGINIFNQKEGFFHFNAGPLFANIVLADEINRASPRTQSALLEAMSEEQVTVDGNSHRLPSPFMVMATQNPIEYHGTYPLPEAQLDRFMLQIDLGYLAQDEEKSLLLSRRREDPVEAIDAVVTLEDLQKLREFVDTVRMEESVGAYLLNIVLATRSHPQVRLGVSTRGSLLFARVVRAKAILAGRDYVIPEDVKELAAFVLAHRILLNSKAQHGGLAARDIIVQLISSLKVPN